LQGKRQASSDHDLSNLFTGTASKQPLKILAPSPSVRQWHFIIRSNDAFASTDLFIQRR